MLFSIALHLGLITAAAKQHFAVLSACKYQYQIAIAQALPIASRRSTGRAPLIPKAPTVSPDGQPAVSAGEQAAAEQHACLEPWGYVDTK